MNTFLSLFQPCLQSIRLLHRRICLQQMCQMEMISLSESLVVVATKVTVAVVFAVNVLVDMAPFCVAYWTAPSSIGSSSDHVPETSVTNKIPSVPESCGS